MKKVGKTLVGLISIGIFSLLVENCNYFSKEENKEKTPSTEYGFSKIDLNNNGRLDDLILDLETGKIIGIDIQNLDGSHNFAYRKDGKAGMVVYESDDSVYTPLGTFARKKSSLGKLLSPIQ